MLTLKLKGERVVVELTHLHWWRDIRIHLDDNGLGRNSCLQDAFEQCCVKTINVNRSAAPWTAQSKKTRADCRRRCEAHEICTLPDALKGLML